MDIRNRQPDHHPTDEDNQYRTTSQPALACKSCRSRKIKCNRELPRCSTCVKSSQLCQYPSGPLKPGPKLGISQQRPRKKARVRDIRDTTFEPNLRLADKVGSQDSNNPSITHYARVISSTDYWEETQDIQDERLGILERVQVTDIRTTQKCMPLSPVSTVWQSTPKSDSLSMYDLSSIIHPSDDASFDKHGSVHENEGANLDSEPILLARACDALNISLNTMHKLIKLYFANMTSFSLFRQPVFEAKLRNISSLVLLNALLSAMFSFAVLFDTEQQESYGNTSFSSIQKPRDISNWFLNLALDSVDEALRDCGDDAPSLCLLQALILTTFQQLIRGVRGNAWRALGGCVRIAYELHLHLIDTDKVNHSTTYTEAETLQWCHDEERRRAWWAIWEMDTFASTIRRSPTAIDWSQNEVYLPVEDNLWFRGQVQQSCFLERKTVNRWRVLQNSGNQSSKAWFIVVNSIMKEAQLLSTPKGVPLPSSQPNKDSVLTPRAKPDSRILKDVSERLVILENSLRCFTMALPISLKYRDEYLTFTSCNVADAPTLRQLHNSRYSIHMMTQLTKFMIHHYKVFRSPNIDGITESSCDGIMQDKPFAHESEPVIPDLNALNRYMEAAESIVTLVNRSSDDHVRYVNPFLGNTIWLAAAVQLVYKVFCPSETDKSLVDSNFNVLRLNYRQFADFWTSSCALQQKLDLLEAQLKRFRNPSIQPRAAENNGQNSTDDDNPGQLTHPLSNPSAGKQLDSVTQQINNGWSYQTNQNNPQAYTHMTNEIQGLVEPSSQIDGVKAFDEAPYGIMPDFSLEGFGFGFDGEMNAGLPYYLNGLLSGSFME